MKLSKGATLREIRPMLADPEHFVSKAFGVIHKASKTDSSVRLRLGITGTGQYPNYRLEDATGKPTVAIDGANHEPWPEGEKFDGSDTWSDATMTRHEVESLLGEIRNFERK